MVLADIKTRKNNINDISEIWQNNINSQLNFKVPGIAKYIKTIKITDSPKLGELWDSPTTSAVCLDWNLRCTQSTRKNINDDKIACIKQKITPTLTIGEYPNKKHITIKFISWIVQNATSFFKSTWVHIFKEASITPTEATVNNNTLLAGKLRAKNSLYKPNKAVLTKNPLKYILKLPGASTWVFVNQ